MGFASESDQVAEQVCDLLGFQWIREGLGHEGEGVEANGEDLAAGQIRSAGSG